MTTTFKPIAGFSQQLCAWQQQFGRHDLPWQHPAFSPYRVWVSEIMLQQTQVQTVIAYFERFMARWPTLQDLANAPEADVLHAWSGLGYYRRARHLHAAAKHMMAAHAGVPQDHDQLMALPGIGRSTAGAILSLGFNQAVPILDGNVKRVFSRLHGVVLPPNTRDIENALWALAAHYIAGSKPACHNQALMDLGATLCTPKKPQCGVCPFQDVCVANQTQSTDVIPAKKPKKKVQKKDFPLYIIIHRSQFWLTQRPDQGLWAKYWCFPEHSDAWQHALYTQHQHHIDTCEELPAIKHCLTHMTLSLQPVVITLNHRTDFTALDPHGQWQDQATLNQLALPKPVHKCLEALQHPSTAS